MGAAVLTFLLLLVSVWPARGKRTLRRVVFAMGAVLVLAIGCGGGGGSGGSGGGSSTQVPTSIAISVPKPKAGQDGLLSVSAKVTSSKPLSGTVTFFSVALGTMSSDIPVTADGSANFQLILPELGYYQIYARYNGDLNNLASKSGNVAAAKTGSTQVALVGVNNAETQSVSIPVTIQ